MKTNDSTPDLPEDPDFAAFFQFRVLISVSLLARIIGQYKSKSSWIAFSLTDKSLEISASESAATAVCNSDSVPYFVFAKGARPTDAQVAATLGRTERCYAERIPGSSEAIRRSSITNVRFDGGFLIRALALGGSGADFVELSLGRIATREKQPLAPLRMCFAVRNSLDPTSEEPAIATTIIIAGKSESD
jgi:hypothetical protein